MINFDIDSFWKKCLTLSKDKDEEWKELALTLFQYQYHNNELYRSFCNHFIASPLEVDSLLQIPFLPISFFKSHEIVTPDNLIYDNSKYFQSSGTTGSDISRHFIINEQIYKEGSKATFEHFFGSLEDKILLCLLPNYLEQGNSSLVYMCDYFIRNTNNNSSGFYLYEMENLHGNMKRLLSEGKDVILIGVAYALIDFATSYPDDFSGLKVIETGGMKGRRTEWTKEQLHDFLRKQMNIDKVSSEYGMTELFSQAYSLSHGIFYPSSTMKIFLRDINDPLNILHQGQGLINIIDLANIHSCSFIATDDIGRLYEDGTFEVLGRSDNAILRGCNALVQ